MPDQLQLRGGTTVQHSTFTGASKEVTVDTTKKTVVVHDGSTAGGNPMLREDASNSALALGSAGTPSLKFTGDPNTGIYSPGADQVAISTGGSGRLFINSSGQVGVGTVPGSTFDLSGTTSRIRWDLNNAYTLATHGNAAFSAFAPSVQSAADFQYQIAGTEKMRLDSSGRLGVGTSAPPSILALNGTDPLITFQNAATNRWQLGYENTNSHRFVLYDTNAAAYRLVVDSSGRVGIGTSSPGRNLTVQNSSTIVAASLVSNPANIAYLLFGDTDSDAQGRVQYDNSSDSLQLYSSGSERVRIDSSGNVGIGTTSPTRSLVVAAGSTSSNGILVTGSNSPSYRIEETSGSVAAQFGLDGSASYFGTSTNHPQVFNTNATERARIDTSGRWLLGTSSSSASAAAVLQGFAGSPSGQGILQLQVGKNTAATVVNENLGSLRFANSDGNIGALISGEADLQWNSGDYPSRLVFSVTQDGSASPTERARIRNAGNFNAFAPNDTFAAWNSNSAGTTYVNFLGVAGATGIANGSGTVNFVVYNNGNVQNTNNSYTAYSDIKLKENIVDAGSQWEDIKAFQIRKYNFKEETGHQTHTQIGLIAQEAELISPGLVCESPDRDAEGNDLGTVTKSVNYSVLYMKAVKALQEAMERIETLEAKVAALESA